ncbi:phage tail protein [Deinococcus altitudinis]|uniref:phage tail protein n=1 Tax=Deinococcus altitudinis TaxID=468914 RepID=UPI003891A21B
MSEPFVGEIRVFGFNFAPQGWAQCNGQLLSIAQNTALFSLLGTNYGGDGRVTFGLPNLQGAAALHVGSGAGPGLSQYFLGQTGGSQTVTLLQNEMPAHTHALGAVTDPAESGSPAGNVLARSVGGPVYASGPANAQLAAGAVSPQGGNQPHNNLPPYLVANFCIALQGVYPQRP